MSYDRSKVAFVDTETTGLDPETDAIWEIAVIVDDEEIVWQQALTDRQIANVHPDAAKITGFHDRYDPTAVTTPSSSIRRLIGLVEGRHLIGACSWFDSDRLHRVVLGDIRRRLPRDLPWHYHLIDVENMAVGYIRGMRHAHRQITEHGYPAEFDDHGFDEMALPWKSTELSLALGVDPDDFQPKHTALTDARWAKAMYEAMMGDPT